MPRVKRVAVLGALGGAVLLGTVGCTAEANSGNPTGTPTPVVSQPGAARANIEVQLQPATLRPGQKVWILANCPIPQGGPQHRGTARSEAFLTAVTLDPILVTPTPAPTGTATPTPRPWVRGQATVAEETEPNVYAVNVRCEGTNDTGTANLRVMATSTPSPRPTTTRTPISTRGPGTGGGGTAAGGPEDSGMPAGMTGVLLAAALAGGIGLAVVRRRRP
ncbi:hypothetical protein GCM10010156_44590 [Planobispora rosea]|uniref:Gram-positive cocci surface proteins LPxTG domain-containing protein n=1 Tax=Planobispora rosea TaxID=35762 RepID=A0A8J3S346_PLARO|nr:hypothetical protein [Planobispora rosea]GGS80886.1 hypothetical protein GCM10010156_44590 [Planobispora rosea]GIH85950.1 hypothetical protein Pro02_43580 [Planobispora rosea]